MTDGHSPVVSLMDVTKYFYKSDTRITAVSAVSFDVERGSFVSIVGPSGCGKSTILNMIAGLEKPDKGVIYHNGTPVTDVQVGIGYLTQRDTLLPWRTVAENVRFPLELRLARSSVGRSEVAARVQWAIGLVGLTGFEGHLPGELSGGMRKRAALAQSLVYARETLLMDEPFGALDFQLRLQMHAQLMEIWSRERRTILFVTHDIEEAVTLSDRIIVFSQRPGRVKDVIAVDIPRPRDPIKVRFNPRFQELIRTVWDELDVPAVSGGSGDAGA